MPSDDNLIKVDGAYIREQVLDVLTESARSLREAAQALRNLCFTGEQLDDLAQELDDLVSP